MVNPKKARKAKAAEERMVARSVLNGPCSDLANATDAQDNGLALRKALEALMIRNSRLPPEHLLTKRQKEAIAAEDAMMDKQLEVFNRLPGSHFGLVEGALLPQAPPPPPPKAVEAPPPEEPNPGTIKNEARRAAKAARKKAELHEREELVRAQAAQAPTELQYLSEPVVSHHVAPENEEEEEEPELPPPEKPYEWELELAKGKGWK